MFCKGFESTTEKTVELQTDRDDINNLSILLKVKCKNTNNAVEANMGDALMKKVKFANTKVLYKGPREKEL